ncbi:MAG: non-canonical purine NTP pyrophosphatase [Acidimicrobiia bacterium]
MVVHNPARIIPFPPGTALLIATTNPGKVREIRPLLGDDVHLLTLADLPPIPEPEEHGATFAENARLKALAYAAATGSLTLAEDSGLVIDALDGAPGVHSARYPGATYPDKFANLYAALHDRPRPWTARYVCAVAIARGRQDAASGGEGPLEPEAAGRGGRGQAEGEVVFECEGRCEGEIAAEPRGKGGFGYDPIFYFPPYGRTFGEVSDPEKLAVAHRGHAMRQVKRWLDVIRGELPR